MMAAPQGIDFSAGYLSGMSVRCIAALMSTSAKMGAEGVKVIAMCLRRCFFTVSTISASDEMWRPCRCSRVICA